MFEFKHYDTDNSIQVNNACIKALQDKRLMVLLGYSGSGKTFAINHFMTEYSGVYKINLGESVKAKEMYSRILNKIDNTDDIYKITTTAILKRIKSKLQQNTGRRLIFIDEGGKFQKNSVGYFHELRDLTDENCGIIIAAPYYFEQNLLDWISGGVNGVEEFYSRVNSFVELERPKNKEIIGLFKVNGLDKTKKQQEFIKTLLKIPPKKRTWRDIRMLTIKFLDEN